MRILKFIIILLIFIFVISCESFAQILENIVVDDSSALGMLKGTNQFLSSDINSRTESLIIENNLNIWLDVELIGPYITTGNSSVSEKLAASGVIDPKGKITCTGKFLNETQTTYIRIYPGAKSLVFNILDIIVGLISSKLQIPNIDHFYDILLVNIYSDSNIQSVLDSIMHFGFDSFSDSLQLAWDTFDLIKDTSLPPAIKSAFDKTKTDLEVIDPELAQKVAGIVLTTESIEKSMKGFFVLNSIWNVIKKIYCDFQYFVYTKGKTGEVIIEWKWHRYTIPSPILSVSPLILDYKNNENVKVFDIINVGGGTLNWNVTENASWITSIVPNSGKGNGRVSVTINRANLSIGNYSDYISVVSANGENKNIMVKASTSMPFITANDFNQKVAEPGNALNINYTISNPTSQNIIANLGCSIWEINSREVTNDQPNDRTVTLFPGINIYSRQFVLPSNLKMGQYTLDWGLWSSDFLVAYDFKESYAALNVVLSPTKDTIPPQVTIKSPVGGENWLIGQQQTIRWSATDNVGVNHIDILFSSNGGASWRNIATQIANSGQYNWVPDTVSNNNFLRVIAYDNTGNPAFDLNDNYFSIIASCSTLSAPTLNVPSSSGGNGYIVSWSNVNGANSYVLREDTTFSFLNAREYPTNQNSRYFDNKTPGTYFYQVCSVNNCGRGAWSSIMSYSYQLDTQPSRPSAISPNNKATISDSFVTLRWQVNGGDGQLRYTVYFAHINPTGNSPIAENITQTDYMINNLEYKSEYYWAIKVQDQDGDTSFSDVFMFTVEPEKNPPTGSVVINNGDAATVSFSVTMTLSATDTQSAVRDMRFSNDGVNWSGWVYYQTTYNWSRANYNYGGNSSNGIKTVYVQFRDFCDNPSISYTDTIEKISGTPGSIILNGRYYETIEDAMNDAKYGDCIYLTEGVYNILAKQAPLDIRPSLPSFIRDKMLGIVMRPGVSLIGAGAEKTLIQSNTSPWYVVVDAENSLIEGLMIENSQLNLTTCAVGLMFPSSKVKYCILRGSSKGIELYENASNNEIFNSIIINNKYGIDNHVINSNMRIYNNTICNNDILGIAGQDTSVLTKNNIVSYNNCGMGGGDGITVPSVGYNNVWGNTLNYGLIDLTGQNGNISSNPLFIDSQSGNYRLSSSSPCINTGINVGISYNGSPDMGAFEYNGKGTIQVISNLPESSFTITGPQNFTGSGINWSQSNVPIGVYSIKFDPIANSYTPYYISKVLESNQTITFDGSYVMDTQAPAVTISVNYGEYATPDRIVYIALSASDEITNVGEMKFSNDGITWSQPEPYSSLKRDWDLGLYGENLSSGLKTVFAKVSDSLGNWTTAITDDVLYVPNRRILSVPEEYSTIQLAIDNAQEGDMVWVAPGTYQQQAEVVLKNGVRLQGAGSDVTILDLLGKRIVAANNSSIDGFTFLYNGIYCSGVSAIISNNIFKLQLYVAIGIYNNCNLLIKNNVIPSSPYFFRGIAIYDQSSNAMVTIENNAFFGNPHAIDNAYNIINNIPDTRIYVRNNIIANCGDGIADNTTDLAHKHIFSSFNCFWNNTGGNFVGNNKSRISSEADINADPMFADSSNGSFSLQIGSPCVDGGNSEEKYNDMNGTRNDMGAYGGHGTNTKPNAGFTVDSGTNSIGKSFTFDSSLSSDKETERSQLSFRWDWENDGVFDTPFSENQQPTHSYQSPGEKTVTLQVRDKGGFVSSLNRNINVINNPPNIPNIPVPADEALEQSTMVSLSWSGGDPDTGDTVIYDVYIGASTEPSLVSSGQPETIYTPARLDYYKSYYWKVIARDSHGATSNSLLWQFTTGIMSLPSNPSGLQAYAESGSEAKAQLTWIDNSDNENGFKIERKIGMGGVYKEICELPANTTTYTDNYLIGRITYYYRIRAFNLSGNSGYCQEQSITTPIVWGDVTNDGVVNLDDVTAIQQWGVGLINFTSSQLEVADVSGNGRVSAYDAALIYQYICGFFHDFPVENIPDGAPSIVSIGEGNCFLKLEKGYFKPGTEFIITVNLKEAKNVIGINLTLDYDQNLIAPIEISAFQFSDYLMEYGSLNGRLQFSLSANKTIKDGALIKIKFRISQSTTKATEGIRLSDVILNEANMKTSQMISLNVIPYQFKLLQNYPNPFNPETWIPYELSEDSEVSINIYNISGQLVRRLDLGYHPKGVYYSRSTAAYWDGKNELGESLASGIYFYRIDAGEKSAIGKMIIMR